MDTKKLKEEIKLLERKLELMEQINRLQAIPVYPVYPPVYWPDRYPFYPQPIYPWDRVICSSGTTITTGVTTGGACEQTDISTATIIKDDAQVSYIN